MKIKLNDVLDVLELNMDETQYFYNKTTEEIICVTSGNSFITESDELPDYIADWENDAMNAAFNIVENIDNYISLPEKFDINEYQIVLNFCHTYPNKIISNHLCSIIRCKNYLKKFNDCIKKYNIEAHWYKYREEALMSTIIEWCNENHITLIE